LLPPKNLKRRNPEKGREKGFLPDTFFGNERYREQLRTITRGVLKGLEVRKRPTEGKKVSLLGARKGEKRGKVKVLNHFPVNPVNQHEEREPLLLVSGELTGRSLGRRKSRGTTKYLKKKEREQKQKLTSLSRSENRMPQLYNFPWEKKKTWPKVKKNKSSAVRRGSKGAPNKRV